MTNQIVDVNKKVELQADIIELYGVPKDIIIKAISEISPQEELEYFEKIKQNERYFELMKDWVYLNNKNRELNSFEKGIKEECERLLNE